MTFFCYVLPLRDRKSGSAYWNTAAQTGCLGSQSERMAVAGCASVTWILLARCAGLRLGALLAALSVGTLGPATAVWLGTPLRGISVRITLTAAVACCPLWPLLLALVAQGSLHPKPMTMYRKAKKDKRSLLTLLCTLHTPAL